MSLVNSNRNKNKPKILDRGPDIKPVKQVTRSEVEQALAEREQANKPSTGKKGQQIEKITYSTNIRVDNHDRNSLDALKYMGAGPSHQAILKVLISNYLDGMPREYIEEFKMELDRNEKKDARLKGNK